jgi:hypothetical protein
VFSFDTSLSRALAFSVDCCVINCRWLWAASAQSNCCVVHLLLLFFRVHLRPSWLSHPLLLSSRRLPIVSITNRIKVERVGWLLHLPAQPPITSCAKAHHLQQSSHIARICASSTEAVSLARQSNEQPRWQRRQQKVFGGCWVALVAIVWRFGGRRTWFWWLSCA